MGRKATVIVNRVFKNRLMLFLAHQESIRIESISRRNGDNITFQFKFLDDTDCLAEMISDGSRPKRLRSFDEFKDCVRSLL
jgi:hypothetical protein